MENNIKLLYLEDLDYNQQSAITHFYKIKSGKFKKIDKFYLEPGNYYHQSMFDLNRVFTDLNLTDEDFVLVTVDRQYFE